MLFALGGAAALASDVDVAVVDVTSPTNSVSLAPGDAASIKIDMSVTGNQVGDATFEVYRDWTLSGGTFTGSNPQEFAVAPRSGGDAATKFSTMGTVTIAAGQAAGGPFTLEVGAFDITNSNSTGAKLAVGKSILVLRDRDVSPDSQRHHSTRHRLCSRPARSGWDEWLVRGKRLADVESH